MLERYWWLGKWWLVVKWNVSYALIKFDGWIRYGIDALLNYDGRNFKSWINGRV
jgi:hypothetical protein